MTFRGHRLFSRRGAWAAAVVMAVMAGSVVLVSAMRASAETVDVYSWYVLVNRNSGKVLDDRSSGGAALK